MLSELITKIKEKDEKPVLGMIVSTPQQELCVADDGKTVLHYAAEKGLEKVVKVLLTKMSLKAVNIVAEDSNHTTALRLATCNGHEQIAGTLVEKMGPEAISAIECDKTALDYAITNNQDTVIKQLLDKMPFRDAVNVLHKAIANDTYARKKILYINPLLLIR